jgi:thiol:disulfide interchange protein DsbD
MLGGAALLMMGIGMSIPLIVIGTFEGAVLPKTGPWSQGVKTSFGFLLLAVAIWLLARIVTAQVNLVLWALWCLMAAIFAGAFSAARSGWQKIRRAFSFALLIYGVLLMVGMLLGNTNPLKPLENLRLSEEVEQEKTSFRTIYTLEELEKALVLAKRHQQAVVLKVYAEWCGSCRSMEKGLFQEPMVREALQDFILLKADITQFDKNNQRLMAKLNAFAPPVLLFFNVDGQELTHLRSYGLMTRDELLDRIAQLKAESR